MAIIYRMNSKCAFAGDYKMLTVRELTDIYPEYMVKVLEKGEVKLSEAVQKYIKNKNGK